MIVRKLLTAGSVVLISLATEAAAGPAALLPAVQTGHGALILAQADQVDPRASEDLSTSELRTRILLLRRLVEGGQEVNGVSARELLRADRQELKRRRDGGEDAAQQETQEGTAGAAPPPAQSGQTGPQQPQSDQAETGAGEPERRKRRPQQEEPAVVTPQAPAQETQQVPATQQAAPEQPKAEEPPAERQAEPVAPARQEPAAEETRPRRERKPAEQEVQQATPEQSPRAQEPQLDLSILRDRRPAIELTDAELRERIRALGELQKRARLDKKQLRRLEVTIETDTAELNRRITATTGVDVGGIDVNREARRLLADDRPARRLDDDQLRERIRLMRGVLSLEGLDPRFEEQLRRALRQDRQELRARVAEAEAPSIVIRDPQRVERRELRRQMIDAREQRRQRLDDPSYRIIIPEQRIVRRPLATIPLAEAYDEELEYQLSAPPARPIERRYSLEEYRANPSLRTLMPGVEVDTVKFGFNEDFLREEEIVKLDRIGEILERIVAGNPEEVFLIEGHTDLVGSDAYNEALSYRRAAAVRDALTEFFYIPPRNLEIVGYGEQFPRIPTEFEEPENRRVTVRRITPILYGSTR